MLMSQLPQYVRWRNGFIFRYNIDIVDDDDGDDDDDNEVVHDHGGEEEVPHSKNSISK